MPSRFASRVEHFNRGQADAFGIRLPDEIPLRLDLMSLMRGRIELRDSLQIRETKRQIAQAFLRLG